jgi:putative peptide zinc metalloprotease protein
VSLAGIPAYIYLRSMDKLSFITGTSSSLSMGLVGLLAAEIFAVFAHESAHALTTKSYCRSVRAGGVGLYFGMVTFFMDTTDIWMEPRRPRLAVTWAGPFSGFFLGGLASIAIALNPASSAAGVAFQFATFCFLLSTLNLNPLLKLDGYYFLMDWLEIPMLRERAMRFIQQELVGKLRLKQKLTKEERIFSIFGALSLAYTALMVYAMAVFAMRATQGFLERLFGQQLALAVTVVLVAGTATLLVWQILSRIAKE